MMMAGEHYELVPVVLGRLRGDRRLSKTGAESYPLDLARAQISVQQAFVQGMCHQPRSIDMDNSRIRRRGILAMAGATIAGVGGLLAGAHAKAAAGPRLTVGPIRRVGADGAKHIEPWIAANPGDALNLVVVGTRLLGVAATPGGFEVEPAAWFTIDGGNTWSAGELAGTALLRRKQAFFADAHATYTPDGIAFCVFNGSPEGDRLDLWIYRSENGGRNWHGPTHLAGGGLDYPRLAADMNHGRPRVYIAVAVEGDRPIMGKLRKPGYGCAILRSEDGARTFSAVNFLAPTTLQHDPINSPLILPDGGLLVGFADYASVPSGERPREHITHSRTYTASSRDGGETFSTPAPIRDTLLQDGFLVLAVEPVGWPAPRAGLCSRFQPDRESSRAAASDQ